MLSTSLRLFIFNRRVDGYNEPRDRGRSVEKSLFFVIMFKKKKKPMPTECLETTTPSYLRMHQPTASRGGTGAAKHRGIVDEEWEVIPEI